MDWYRQHFIFVPFSGTSGFSAQFCCWNMEFVPPWGFPWCCTPLSRQVPTAALTAPVVHQHHPKDVLLGPADGNGLPKLVSRTYKERLKSKSNVLIVVLELKIFAVQRVADSSNRGWTGWVLHHFPHTFGQNPWPAPLFFPSMKLAGLNYLRALCC